MDIYAFPPVAAILDAAYAVLMQITALLEPLTGAAAAAASVPIPSASASSATAPVEGVSFVCARPDASVD